MTNSNPRFPLGEVTYDTLSKAVTQDVSEALAARSSRGRNMIIGATAVAATVLLTLSGVGIPLYISNQVSKQFDTFREQELSELYFMRDLSTLDLLMSQVDPTAPTVFIQLDRVLEQVRHIEDTYLAQSKQRPRRTRALDAQVADRRDVLFNEFARTPAPGQIALFVNAMTQASEFEVSEIQVGVQALGRELIGARNGAAEWMEGDGDIAAMFPAYIAATERARQNLFPELALLFELIRLHMEEANHDDIPILLAELEDLRPQDREIYVDLMSDFLTQEWHPRPDSWSERIAERAGAFAADTVDHPVIKEALAEAAAGGYQPRENQ